MNLVHLPLETLEYIFILSGSSSLAYVNHVFYSISKPAWIRAFWILFKFREKAFSHCWNVRFFKQSCDCSSKNFKNEEIDCDVETYQLQLLSWMLTCSLGKKEFSLIEATRSGHLRVIEMLLETGQANANFRIQSTMSFSMGSKLVYLPFKTKKVCLSECRPRSISFLQKLIESDQTLIAQLFLKNAIQPISKKTLLDALEAAIKLNRPHMMELLIQKGSIEPRLLMVKELFSKVFWIRFISGKHEAYFETIQKTLKYLKLQDLESRAAVILKSCGELGCISGLQVCMERGIDINLHHGIALCSTIYNGNEECFYFLASQPQVDLNLFSSSHWVFCCTLMGVEIIAFTMYILLLISWVTAWMNYTRSVQKNSFSPIELTFIVIPCTFTVIIMYRIIPIHKVIRILYHLKRFRQLENLHV